MENYPWDVGTQHANHYVKFDPVARLSYERPGTAWRLSRLVPEDRWGKDPFTSDYAALLGFRDVVRTSVPVSDGLLVSFGAFRAPDRPGFTDDELRAIELLQPILSRMAFAALVSEKLAMPTPPGGGKAAIGFALFAPTGDPVHADAGARAFLTRLASVPGATDRVAAEVLKLASARTADAVAERTFLLDGHLALRVNLTRVGAEGASVAAIFQELALSSDASLGAAAARIGLTTREREIARLVLEGRGNRGIAFALDLSIDTVKTHLKHVFRKAGVASRTELAALLLGGSSG
jgi:DNA-binding CsgD family transcriptional regulator